MADTLVERLTGQDSADAVPVEIGVLVPLDALTDEPALIPGHGTTPTHTITGHTSTDTDTGAGERTGGGAGAGSRGKTGGFGAPVFVRRLFTHPISGKLVGMESTRRNYPELLRQLVTYREGGVCHTPGCDALIQRIDHATPVRSGGQTTWDNASGLCARCNYVKENPGWKHDTTSDTLTITTPTGHTYTTHPPTRPTHTTGATPLNTFTNTGLNTPRAHAVARALVIKPAPMLGQRLGC